MTNTASAPAPTTTTLTARWWHPSGFWTTGTFEGATVEQATASITRARGTHITVSPR